MSIIRKQINENIFLAVNSERNETVVEICGQSYDLTDKIGKDDLYKGFFGFPITIDKHPFGCGMYTGKMSNTHDLNNLCMVLYDYSPDSLEHNNYSRSEYDDIDVRSTFKKFKGNYVNEKFMGYGTQHIVLDNDRVSEFEVYN